MENLRQQATALLKRFYGYNSFRPMQLEVIECAMSGRDSVVLMPTGGGKSICFQIPALMSEGCAIVVSPLLALMKDQVDALIANGIPAATINSAQTESYNREVIEHVFAGHIKLLYISPERLLSEIGQWSQSMRVSLFAIDEAHCISQWGHDFRPEYTQLATLKKRFPHIPVMALTATADRLTRDDITRQLNIPDAKMFISSFDRKNISLSVISDMSGKEKTREITRFIDRHPGQSGIIYCLSRKNAENMAAKLKKLGYNAQAFHAGLDTAVKNKTQQDFINDDLTIICATVAFGMGINKSNVRWIIHSNMPRNIESYYQEIGRAGRDGLPADALMFYSFADVATLMSFARDSGQASINIEKLRRMQQYAQSTVCRRRILLSYFNERRENDCGNCDVCKNPPVRIDGTTLCQMALSAIARTSQNERTGVIIDILRGVPSREILAKGYNNLKTFGVGRNLSIYDWRDYTLQMLQLGIVDIAYDQNNALKITDYGRDILMNRRKVTLSQHENRPKEPPQKKKQEQQRLPLDDTPDENLLNLLKQARTALAKAKGVPPYIIFSDKSLDSMAREKPTTKAQFATLYGVGERKTELYWRQFTTIITNHIKCSK